jgi:CBS domain-containing protein
MRVTDVMSTDVRTVEGGELIPRARAMMADARVHHLVVLHDGHVVGLVSADQLELGQAEGVRRVEDVMCRHLRCAMPALPIVSRDRVVGIVTASDLLDVIARSGDSAAASKRGQAGRARGHTAPVVEWRPQR